MIRRLTAAAFLALAVTAGFGALTPSTPHTDTATGNRLCLENNWPPAMCEEPKGPWEWD